MRLFEFATTEDTTILREGVKLKSPQEVYAYACVVSEAYDAAPAREPDAVKAFGVLYQSIAKLLKRAKSDVDVNFTPDDPYSSPEEVGNDIIKNKNLDVYSGHSDHPVLTPDQNVEFRAVHDYFAHIGPNRKSKGKYKSHNFTLRGEYNAYVTHARMAPKGTVAVLFTEVVGQASYFNVMGNFPEQKAAVLPGFDYIDIGVMDEAKTARFEKIVAMLMDDSVPGFKLKIKGGHVVDKSKIDWTAIATSGKK